MRLLPLGVAELIWSDRASRMRCDRLVSVTGAIASEPGWRSRCQALIEDKTKDFVGREYVFNAIADFLTNQPNGYFIIEGDPGMGKSPILAEYIYINLERWLHHNLIGYRVKQVYMRFNDRTHQQRPSLILDSVRSPSELQTLSDRFLLIVLFVRPPYL